MQQKSNKQRVENVRNERRLWEKRHTKSLIILELTALESRHMPEFTCLLSAEQINVITQWLCCRHRPNINLGEYIWVKINYLSNTTHHHPSTLFLPSQLSFYVSLPPSVYLTRMCGQFRIKQLSRFTYCHWAEPIIF